MDNAQRSDRFKAVIISFLNDYGGTFSSAVVTLLADARHWCDRHRHSFGVLDKQAYVLFLETFNENVGSQMNDDASMIAGEMDLIVYLDACHIRLLDLGCFVALSSDREDIYYCPMDLQGEPCQLDKSGHFDWIWVTAPIPEFLDWVNELYGTRFHIDQFAGR